MNLILEHLRSKGLRQSFVWSLWVALYCAAVTALQRAARIDTSALPIALESIFVFGGGVLLVFRTNRAYDRWWEARGLLATIANATRTLAIEVRHIPRIGSSEQARAGELLVEFARRLVARQREDGNPAHGSEGKSSLSNPFAAASELVELIWSWKQDGWLSDVEGRAMLIETSALVYAAGGCDRIRTTKVAQAGRLVTSQLMAFFILTLPWELAPDYGWLTVAIAWPSAYLAIAMVCVAEELEHPFRRGPAAIDLEAIYAAIEQTVRENLPRDHHSIEPVGEMSVVEV